MSEQARLLQDLYMELVLNGFDDNMESFIGAADENLQELDRLIHRDKASQLRSAWCAESGYWLYRIKELALAAAANR